MHEEQIKALIETLKKDMEKAKENQKETKDFGISVYFDGIIITNMTTIMELMKLL